MWDPSANLSLIGSGWESGSASSAVTLSYVVLAGIHRCSAGFEQRD
ncbi:hypothetical protein CYB_2766 [Synechococcus sp. JA-2-3B'a(2-13)]|nr:hypothetical protein CYB_2766 [Synechococcus sp. JA-2-3B'a(2-13)]